MSAFLNKGVNQFCLETEHLAKEQEVMLPKRRYLAEAPAAEEEATEEATDAQVAAEEDDFPDVSPDALEALPPTAKYAIVGECAAVMSLRVK